MPETSRAQETTQTGRVAWVTGGSRGIGAACSVRLARMGHAVAVGFHENQLEADKTVAAVEDAGSRAIAVGGDMSDPSAVTRALDLIETELGSVSALVASHGIYERKDFSELTLEAWRRTIQVDLDGCFLTTKAVIPAMQQAKWGRIVYMGSILGRIGTDHGADYATAKAGLHGLSRSVAKEYAADGITVNVVAPSMIETDMLAGDSKQKRAERRRKVPVGRIGGPEECAAAVAYLVSDDAGYVTGTELRVDGGFQMG